MEVTGDDEDSDSCTPEDNDDPSSEVKDDDDDPTSEGSDVEETTVSIIGVRRRRNVQEMRPLLVF